MTVKKKLIFFFIESFIHDICFNSLIHPAIKQVTLYRHVGESFSQTTKKQLYYLNIL